MNYGNGYVGRGYYGGYWNNNQFNYNRQVTNVNITVIHNTYIRNVTNITTYNRVSYSGGRGGVNLPPSPAELAALRQPRLPPLAVQQQHRIAASTNRAQFAAVNRGQPQTVVWPSRFPWSGISPLWFRGAAAPTTPAPHPAGSGGQRPVQQAAPAQQMRPAPQERPVQPVRPAPEERPAPQVRPAPQASRGSAGNSPDIRKYAQPQKNVPLRRRDQLQGTPGPASKAGPRGKASAGGEATTGAKAAARTRLQPEVRPQQEPKPEQEPKPREENPHPWNLIGALGTAGG